MGGGIVLVVVKWIIRTRRIFVWGHTWDSKRDVSKFDKSWSDQNIVDAIVATLENPDYALSGKVKRVVWKDIHGTTVRVSYNVCLMVGVIPDRAYSDTPDRKAKRIVE